MEEQKIINSFQPRVTIGRNSVGFNYSITSSESGGLEEIKQIIDELKESSKYIETKFDVSKIKIQQVKIKEGVAKKK